MKNKIANYSAGILGVIFLILAFIYFTHSANSLPTYLPGYEADLTRIHYKHAIASLILALGLFVYVWFNSNKKTN